MIDTWLIMGLGNPGPRYERTRHNVGQLVVDEIARRRDERWKQHKAGARVAETRLGPGGSKLVLVKSNGFMNTSGGPASALAKFYSIAPDRVIAIHDELDIPFDSLKLKVGGGHGGHNGIRDIAKALDTPDFARVRVGIGRPPGRQDPADWVLSDFSPTERKTLPILVGDAADAAELIVSDGLTAAQQKVHAPC
ncbi:MAG: aminoacyl-tRNA hydrolase [Microbacterium gubbeenense]|uniref:aminoacyl-tRNA hydrolase n=1 Tax=Microbacterium gubbeenense TaxID=159896 RepID=UPI00042A17E4|nr:aminoacyl-tRNA hydrolase [Microbacterium gubbeenense]